jgi:2-amino-4-hydroxy-6-hydroxymethyldihydropteridine diphosphokinase
MPRVLIAFGGNVGDEAAIRETLSRGVAEFCVEPDIRLVARSSDYRTKPWGVTEQPPFINCAIVVATGLPPAALLARAQTVEHKFGRDRSREQRWGPRSLDIDLIAYDDLELDTPDLTLPHPRALERAFVLAPLCEVAPESYIGGVSIADALQRLDRSGVEKLPDRATATSF